MLNPIDEKWIKLKGFNDLNRAIQSFEMLKKHIFSQYKGAGYSKYRLYNKIDKTYKY
jgi:hypothetical protein